MFKQGALVKADYPWGRHPEDWGKAWGRPRGSFFEVHSTSPSSFSYSLHGKIGIVVQNLGELFDNEEFAVVLIDDKLAYISEFYLEELE